MKCRVNHSVRFQVGASQVLNRCSDYRNGHNPGIVEHKQDTDLFNCHACRNAIGWGNVSKVHLFTSKLFITSSHLLFLKL